MCYSSRIVTFLAQLYGIGVLGPLYFFLHYIFIPSTRFHAADNRHVPLHLAKIILPILVLGYLVPTMAMYWPTSAITTLQSWNYVWQLFPVVFAALHSIFSRVIQNTEFTDKNKNFTAEMPWLRLTYFTAAALSSAVWIYTCLFSPHSLYELFLSGVLHWDRQYETLEALLRIFLKVDQLFSFGGAIFWVLLCFWDLKREGRFTATWGKVLASLAAMGVLGGPGTAVVGMWWWREEILARPGLEG